MNTAENPLGKEIRSLAGGPIKPPADGAPTVGRKSVGHTKKTTSLPATPTQQATAKSIAERAKQLVQPLPPLPKKALTRPVTAPAGDAAKVSRTFPQAVHSPKKAPPPLPPLPKKEITADEIQKLAKHFTIVGSGNERRIVLAEKRGMGEIILNVFQTRTTALQEFAKTHNLHFGEMQRLALVTQDLINQLEKPKRPGTLIEMVKALPEPIKKALLKSLPADKKAALCTLALIHGKGDIVRRLIPDMTRGHLLDVFREKAPEFMKFGSEERRAMSVLLHKKLDLYDYCSLPPDILDSRQSDEWQAGMRAMQQRGLETAAKLKAAKN